MAGPRADVREAELLQQRSDVAHVIVDAEPLGDDPLEIDPSPAHDAVFLAIRTGLDDRGQLGQLPGLQARRRAARPVIEQARRPSALKR